MGRAGGHTGHDRTAPKGAALKNVLEEHPKTATIGVVLIAAAVVLLLWFLSTRASTLPSKEPILAHGNEGPVVSSPGGLPGDSATAANYTQGIQQVDFDSVLAGEIAAGRKLENVIYVDINADGTDEAIAAIRGTDASRPLSWRLYGMKDGQVEILFERTDIAQGELQVEGPRVIESEGMYAESDQPCCPSSVKRTYYVWKGDTLVVSRVESAPPGA